MEYSFAPEHDAFRGEVRDFIQQELPPRIAAGEDAYSDENFDDAMGFRRKLGAKRWIGIGWPTEYGGLGASTMMQAIFHEEMIYLNAPLDPQAYQVGPAIIEFGGEDLKKKFLSATANQEILWCQGFFRAQRRLRPCLPPDRRHRRRRRLPQSTAKRSGPPRPTAPTTSTSSRAPTPRRPSTRASPTSCST